jgi:hypothetical protein
MQPSDLHNPYAPPQTDVGGFPLLRAGELPYRAVDLTEALRRLREHVADARNVEADEREAGPRLRRVAWVLLAIGGPLVIVIGWIFTQKQELTPVSETVNALEIAGLVVGAMLVLVGVLVVLVDMTVAERNKPAPPDKTLRSFFKAITTSRYGYTWSCLSPTAREQTVATPDLAPIPTERGVFVLRSKEDLKAYLGTFARPAKGTMRGMTAKRVVLASTEGDIARVDVALSFQSWPRWVNVVAVAGFVVFRPLFLIGVVAYFVARKRRTVQVSKTLLRAQNGLWYVYDGNVLEGAVPPVANDPATG